MPGPHRPTRQRLRHWRRPGAVAAVVGSALALAACGDTIQALPARENDLAHAASEPGFPVYWLGRNFDGMAISSLGRDPGGAYMVVYGNCVTGGQSTCVTPLEIVTSPDNSFLPGGGGPRPRVVIRGRSAALAEQGRTIELATGSVVVSIFGQTAQLARSAATLMDPINEPGMPGALLPKPLPDSHFDEVPIGEPPAPSGVPSPPPSNPQTRASGGPELQPTPSGANGGGVGGR